MLVQVAAAAMNGEAWPVRADTTALQSDQGGTTTRSLQKPQLGFLGLSYNRDALYNNNCNIDTLN